MITRATIGMALGVIAAMLAAFAAFQLPDDLGRYCAATAAACSAGAAYLHAYGGEAPSPPPPPSS